MLICVKEINDNKRFISFFLVMVQLQKLGQTNQKIGTYIDHKNEKIENELYKKTYTRFANKRLQTSRIPLIISTLEQNKS